MEQIKKIIVIGSKGMAGHMIFHYLRENTPHQIIDIARGTDFFIPSYNLDISNFALLDDIFKNERPDIVINCVGVLNQNAENNPDKAVLLNSYFPHFLARIGADIGFKVIHISTDCVFNGTRGSYAEDDTKDGIGIYAQSKALGEINYANNLTIRTSIIGPELKENGIGLFHWFMHQTGTIKGYSEAYWTGVTTLELSKAIAFAISDNVEGLHHLVNNSKISKLELVSMFKQVFNRDVTIERYDGYKVDKSLIRKSLTFNYIVPTYEIMIIEMKKWMSDHALLYNYNFQNI